LFFENQVKRLVSRHAVSRYLRLGAWQPYDSSNCASQLDGYQDWLQKQFEQHHGNAKVLLKQGYRVVFVGARPAGTQLIMQALQNQIPVAPAPLADGHASQPHSLGDGCFGFTGTAGKHYLDSSNDRIWLQT
jgi:hypothetical protein